MNLLLVTSQAHIADFFTKALLHESFHTLLSKLGMVHIYHPPNCGELWHHEEIEETQS